MIWSISSAVLTRQPNIGLGMQRNLNVLNLDQLEIMTRAATFGWVNWSWWGESFPLDLNAPNLNVLRSDVAQIFQPSIDCIVKAVLEQKNNAHKTISVSLYSSFFLISVSNPSSVFLACCARGRVCREWLVILQSIWITYSPWTKHRSSWKPRVSILQDQNDVHTIYKKLFRNKAVSDGAISFYLDHFVRTRVSKVTYGVFFSPEYDPSDPDHRSRSHNVYFSFWD